MIGNPVYSTFLAVTAVYQIRFANQHSLLQRQADYQNTDSLVLSVDTFVKRVDVLACLPLELL